MEEIEIDNSSFEQDSGLKSNLNSTNFKLSGGQTKKAGIIQAAIFKPTILVMDETLVGLDRGSKIKAQEMLKKYLPKTTILCIDHHAHDNNHNGFYDYEVHFANNEVVTKPMGVTDTTIDEDLLLGNVSASIEVEVL